MEIIRIGRQLTKSIWARRLNREMVGHVWHHQLPPVTVRDALAFARAVTTAEADLPPALEFAPRLFLLKLAIVPLKQVCFHPQLGLKFWRMVHAGQHMQWHHPVKIGASIRLQTKIQSIRQTRAGELMRIACRCWADDTLAVTGISSLMVRGKAERMPTDHTPPAKGPARAALFKTRIQTRTWQPKAYADASGDHNPIHTQPWAARLAGLPGPIMHGACVLAMITDTLEQQEPGGSESDLVSIQGRFSRPVIPGQRLALVGYADSGKNELEFQVFNDRSKVVFDHGLLRYRLA